MPAGHIRRPEWLLHGLGGNSHKSQVKHGEEVTSIYHLFVFEKIHASIESSMCLCVTNHKESQLDKTSLFLGRCLYNAKLPVMNSSKP